MIEKKKKKTVDVEYSFITARNISLVKTLRPQLDNIVLLL